ncbi:hypothetical protein [Nocardia camponoti]|uniref:Uncharacterized protein n=1 Tax=Nocardia camponoti TaxID=1616106 RepID=A0A917QH57_9NOCA|nr:hypothetical protein [Nocardia camponoti]GGK48769.1 hypothetical protein GCM10011591_20180 [Nocardia camponoti]
MEAPHTLDAAPLPVTTSAVGSALPSRKWILALVLGLVVILSASAGTIGIAYWLMQPNDVAFAIGSCVDDDTAPVERDCAEPNAIYRVTARERAQAPTELSCVKHANATRAVIQPLAHGKSDIALCLTPTRANTTDAGMLTVNDCVTVQEQGQKLWRVDCAKADVRRVVGIEKREKLPVNDGACRASTTARQAFAQTSLGGRAIVFCTVSAHPSSRVEDAEPGDCFDAAIFAKTSCASPTAMYRVLDVRREYSEPAKPMCASVPNATASFASSSEITDLKIVSCLGPAQLNHIGYANVGACVTGLERAGDTIDITLVDCADPAADGVVSEIHAVHEAECPRGFGSSARFSRSEKTGPALSVCIAAR